MKSYLLIFTVLIFISSGFSQNDQSVVAQIGKDKITTKDFKLRLELSPYIPENKNISPDSVKYDFLFSWIAEKLWADEATQLGIQNTDRFKFYFKPLEDLFARDALFKKEIENKVHLTPEDVNSGIMKSQVKLNTQMISSSDSTEIFRFYDKIRLTNNFDSLLALNPSLTSKDLEVTFGSIADEEIEDSLYALKSNQFTSPIKSEVGWVIFRLKDKILTPIDLGNKEIIKKNDNIIKDRRIQVRYKEYLKDLLSGIKILINPESFNFVSDLIWKKLKNHPPAEDIVNYFGLTEADYESILKSTPKSKLDAALFYIGKEKISVGSFLSQLAFDGFSFDKLDSVAVIQKLKRRAKLFVEDQLITHEAYAQQLNLTEAVRNDLAKWREKYLAQFYFNAVLDSIKISENDVYNFYLNELKDKSNMNLINVRILTLNNLDAISNVLDQIKSGKDFGEIIRPYGQTDSLVNIFGETNLRPVISLGEVGKIVANLKVNEIYGPIQRNNSYSLFQVIERKESDDSVKVSFESIKNQLRSKLRFKRLTDRLNETTAKLAEKYDVKIYGEVVNKINFSEIPMFIHRFMGFGGRIAGMPLVTPFSEWIKEVNKKKLLP